MIHKRGPYRQCVGCRKVSPKGELLRFVHDMTGAPVLDERHRTSGRGFYLCPEERCFTGAWKNKKVRALIKDEESGERLLQSVRTGLLHAVADLLQAGCTEPMDGSLGSLEKGDILLAREEAGGGQIENLLNAAQERGLRVFMVPRTVLRDEETVAITKNSPKIRPVVRNLRLYERLSSKGRAL